MNVPDSSQSEGKRFVLFAIVLGIVALTFAYSFAIRWAQAIREPQFSRDLADYVLAHNYNTPTSWLDFVKWRRQSIIVTPYDLFNAWRLEQSFTLLPSINCRTEAKEMGYGFDASIYAYHRPILTPHSTNIDAWRYNLAIWNWLVPTFLSHDDWWIQMQLRTIESEQRGDRPQPPSFANWREYWVYKYRAYKHVSCPFPEGWASWIENQRRSAGLPPIELE
jgi:hypothetical protein